MLLVALAVWRRPVWLAEPRTLVVGGIVVPAVMTLALVHGFPPPMGLP